MVPSALFDLAQETLDVVAQRFGALGIGLPTRQHASFGEVAFDCDELVVQPSRIFSGMPLNPSARPEMGCGGPRTAELIVWIVRCVPVVDDKGKPPSEDEMNGAALEVMRDGYVLLHELAEAREAGEWLSPCAAVALGNVEWVGPTGDYTGTRITVQALVT